MEDTRPYWKVIVSLAFSLIGTILFIVIGIKLLWFLCHLSSGGLLHLLRTRLCVGWKSG